MRFLRKEKSEKVRIFASPRPSPRKKATEHSSLLTSTPEGRGRMVTGPCATACAQPLLEGAINHVTAIGEGQLFVIIEPGPRADNGCVRFTGVGHQRPFILRRESKHFPIRDRQGGGGKMGWRTHRDNTSTRFCSTISIGIPGNLLLDPSNFKIKMFENFQACNECWEIKNYT